MAAQWQRRSVDTQLPTSAHEAPIFPAHATSLTAPRAKLSYTPCDYGRGACVEWCGDEVLAGSNMSGMSKPPALTKTEAAEVTGARGAGAHEVVEWVEKCSWDNYCVRPHSLEPQASVAAGGPPPLSLLSCC